MKTLGQIACEVYVKSRYDIVEDSNWWVKLNTTERESWEAVARAVAENVLCKVHALAQEQANREGFEIPDSVKERVDTEVMGDNIE